MAAKLRFITLHNKHLNYSQHLNCLDLHIHEKLVINDENTDRHIYLAPKQDSLGVKSNRRQLATVERVSGEHVRLWATLMDEDSFTIGIQIQEKPVSPERIPLCKVRTIVPILQVCKLRQKELSSLCW